jgi:hypothetical protein
LILHFVDHMSEGLCGLKLTAHFDIAMTSQAAAFEYS